MKKTILSLAVPLLIATPAMAATDWTAAMDAWRAQYRDLVLADAARRHCDIDVPKPVRKAMEQARDGLRDALAAFGSPEKARAIVKAAGGEKGLCANGAAMNDAKATIEKFSAQRTESGKALNLPLAAPQAGAPIATNAPTPVVDPNIALIRNCRQAVIAKLGKSAKNNDRFWSTYESCMKDQGAGWF